MTRSHEYHIHQQLEPDDILRTGNAKRHTPAWVQKGKDAQRMRAILGDEEYERRCREFEQWKRDNYDY